MHVLIVDDDPTTLRLHAHMLNELGYKPVMANNGEECIEQLGDKRLHAVLLDINMPKMDGLEVLEYAKKHYPQLPVIMVTALHDVNTAVKAIKLGAYDYLTKPVELDRLATILRNAVSMYNLKNEVFTLKDRLSQSDLFTNIVGESKKLNEVFNLVTHVLETDVNIIIIGESGTGKELVARAIHNGSKRRTGPFVPVNSSAVTFELADSLFFGHKKGSFTGATEDRAGFYEQADGGTIFLDEIGDMDLEIQAKMLRILEERTVRRVGEKNERKIDFRVISATNQDLAKSIAANKFRKDLYFRLEEYPIFLPPLRERREDIPLLAQHFLQEFCENNDLETKYFAEDAVRIMKDHLWPGNIRELKNVVRRSAIRAQGQFIKELILSKFETLGETDAVPAQTVSQGDMSSLDDMEREAIENAYHFTDRNAAQAAKMLGISRATIYRKLKKFGYETP